LDGGGKTPKAVGGSDIVQEVARERREMIEKKHAKRVQEEHFLKL
jgi:hypothetical protein